MQKPDNIESALELLTLPFVSQYKVLAWAGVSDGSLLAPQFDIEILRNRLITIKSFRIVPYYNPGLAAKGDVVLDDGVTTTVEAIPASVRINRLFDVGTVGTGITFRINQTPVLFDTLIAVPLPLDIWLDNIYYKYPVPVSTIDVAVVASIISNLQAATVETASLKLYVECYLQ